MKEIELKHGRRNRPVTSDFSNAARFAFCGVFLILSLNLFAQNPTVSYSTPQTYVVGTAIPALTPTSTAVATLTNSTTPIALGLGFSNPKGIAIDSKGNLYVADYGNNAIKEVPFATNNTITIGSGFNQPTDVKVDAAGNIYVADSGNNEVKEIKAGGGTIVVIGSGFSNPDGVAVDATGNVFVADAGNNAIKKILAGGGAPVTLVSGLNAPLGVGVDISGNVYYTDLTNTLYEIPVAGGSAVVVDNNLINPNDFQMDTAGNIFLANAGRGVITIIPGNGTRSFNVKFKFGNPFGVAVDSKDDLFVTDDNNDALEELVPLGGYAINKRLPAGLIFSNGTGIITGTPTVSSPATTYAITAYNAAGTGSANLTITVNLPPAPTLSYVTPQIYDAGTAITALLPAETGVDTVNYETIATTYGYNTATTTYGSGFAGPMGVAVDSKGNLYVADPNNNLVKEIPAGNGTPIVLGSGFSAPSGVAVDAAGDVFVADYGNNAVKKIPAGNGAPVVLGSGFSHPFSVAVDTAGNVYVTDQGNNEIKKIPAGNGTPIILASGLNSPGGLSLDAAGNVYFPDSGNNEIKEIFALGGQIVTTESDFSQPAGVSSDINGNLYIADKNNNEVEELLAGGGVIVTIGSGFNSPYGVAVDGAGNVYVADYGNNMVKRIKPNGDYYINSALPAGLSFVNATGEITGTPTAVSAAKNYIISAYNLGGGVSRTVNIAVISALKDATLSKLTLSRDTLKPAFAPATTSYTASVADTVASITVTPTAANPHAVIKINGAAVATGTASQNLPLAVGANVIKTVVTAQDGTTTKTYTVTVTRRLSANASLSTLGQSIGGLTPVFSSGTLNYTEKVSNATASMTLKPVSSNAHATIKVNGTALASGTVSGPIALATGPNIITTIVTAQDGITTKTYTLTVTRALSPIASLSNIKLSNGILTPAFATATTGYTASVANTVSTITITPTTTDPTATIKVNGTSLTSGAASTPIALAEGGQTALATVVTAQNGTTKETYTVTVTRAPSANANLATLGQSVGGLTPSFSSTTTSYTINASNATATMTLKPASSDAHATIKVNGTTVASGTITAPIALGVGPNTITTTVTAQNGTTTKTYTLTVTRASGGADSYIPIAVGTNISVTKQTETPTLAEDGIKVHQGVSPNGDGINDFLQIDNISQYPDNKLMIMNRNGQLVFETRGYNNNSKVFDGHSNKNGQMQLPGTYFYQLDYTASGITKHKTGFIVLKY